MLTDMLGKEITVGCWVAFGSRRGSSASTLVRQVIEISDRETTVYDKQDTPPYWVPREAILPCAYFRTASHSLPKENEKGRREVLDHKSCVVVQRDGHPER